MMFNAEFLAGMSIIVSLIFLLVEWRLFSGYRADNFRDQLFTLRDEMFLYALDEGIADTVAHENLRLILNRLIRYAHRVSLGRLLLLDLCGRLFRNRPSTPRVYAQWSEALAALPADQAQHLLSFHNKAMVLMMKHVISGSPLLWLGCGLVAFYVHIFKSTRIFLDRIVNSLKRRSLDLLETDALRTM
jgi:hypothetical protein